MKAPAHLWSGAFFMKKTLEFPLNLISQYCIKWEHIKSIAEFFERRDELRFVKFGGNRKVSDFAFRFAHLCPFCGVGVPVKALDAILLSVVFDGFGSSRSCLVS